MPDSPRKQSSCIRETEAALLKTGWSRVHTGGGFLHFELPMQPAPEFIGRLPESGEFEPSNNDSDEAAIR